MYRKIVVQCSFDGDGREDRGDSKPVEVVLTDNPSVGKPSPIKGINLPLGDVQERLMVIRFSKSRRSHGGVLGCRSSEGGSVARKFTLTTLRPRIATMYRPRDFSSTWSKGD